MTIKQRNPIEKLNVSITGDGKAIIDNYRKANGFNSLDSATDAFFKEFGTVE